MRGLDQEGLLGETEISTMTSGRFVAFTIAELDGIRRVWLLNNAMELAAFS